MTKLGLGATGIFDWITYPFEAGLVAVKSGIDATNQFMQPVTNVGNKFTSLLTGYNVAPVLDANIAFKGVTSVSIAPPTVDSSGNLQMQPLDLTDAINEGFQKAADYQAYQDSSYGGTGTPSTGSRIGLWILLGVGGLVILDVVNGLKK